MIQVAARYVGIPDLEIAQVRSGDPGPGDVEIAVAFTGICGTDLHIVHGDMDHRIPTPMTIGHEMAGTVTRVGQGVGDLGPGRPVTVMPVVSCGVCPTCAGGARNVCPSLQFLGIDAPGSLCNRWIVPADLVFPFPEGFDLRLAALAEPLAVAVHDVRRAGTVERRKVVVLGGGPVGALVALVAAAAGADVAIAEPSSARRRVLGVLGPVVVDAGRPCVDMVGEWTAGVGVDVVFEVSGSQGGAEMMTELLRPRGTGVIVGIHPQPRLVDLFQFFWKELTVTGARVYESEDFAKAVELLAGGAIDPEPLITDVVPLDGANDAIRRLEAGTDAMKVLVDCRT